MFNLIGAMAGTLTTFLQQEGLSRVVDSAAVKMAIEPLTPMGQPLQFRGVSSFVVQNNPENLELPKTIAEYVEMYALGLKRPTLHYVGNKQENFPMVLILEDLFDGPPGATRGGSGDLVYGGFEDLYQVLTWFRHLAEEVPELHHPPFVRFTLGPWSEVGLIEEVTPVVLSAYPNGYPKIMEISLDIRPDFLLVGENQTYFEVPD